MKTFMAGQHPGRFTPPSRTSSKQGQFHKEVSAKKVEKEGKAGSAKNLLNAQPLPDRDQRGRSFPEYKQAKWKFQQQKRFSASFLKMSDTPAQNIAEHLARDHPERFGRDKPRLVREIQAVIDNATQKHSVQHPPGTGSEFYYYKGRTVMVRPNGQGTMVEDPHGNTFRNWQALEP